MVGRLFVLFTAVVYGFFEANLFDHGLHLGPPDFLYWVSWYHIPMFLYAIYWCWTAKSLAAIFVWTLVEDMTFFFVSQDYTLSWYSWITAGLGGIYFPLGFLPTTYLVLLFLWVGCEYMILKWRILPL